MSTNGQLRFIGTVEEAGEEKARVRIFPEFCAGLKSAGEFSHLIILYWMHQRDNEKERQTLLVFPRRHAVNVETGVFASRSPSRPNPIGMCVVELIEVKDCVLVVKGLDAFGGTPIIDIKPYLSRADSIPDARGPEWIRHGPPT
jgi:tRNA-Thr(GGU) m(6)t(6)A37 methyltransferase TsaA